MTTSRLYVSALLAEIDKLNGDLRLMQETVATLVDQRDAARRELDKARAELGAQDRRPACNVAGCDHTRPEECEIVRCAECGEPYDGNEPPARHIARAHLDILARQRSGGIVRSDVTADSPGPFGNGCMFSDVARVFVLPDRSEESPA